MNSVHDCPHGVWSKRHFARCQSHKTLNNIKNGKSVHVFIRLAQRQVNRCLHSD